MTSGHAEPVAGPSGSGTVVLELGPGAGALVLHTPAELNGAEIDISLAAGAGADAGGGAGAGQRTHSMVRPRYVAGGTQYAAVYPSLPPGEYTIWRDDGTPAATVAVTGGIATSARWPVR
jgi:hypothetical protein